MSSSEDTQSFRIASFTLRKRTLFSVEPTSCNRNMYTKFKNGAELVLEWLILKPFCKATPIHNVM
jgi:hypothetical protein